MFANKDGSLTVDAYAVPVNYQTPKGWEPIDNTLRPVAGKDGWVGTSANSWTVRFGSAADGMVLHTAAGDLAVTLSSVGTDASQHPQAAARQTTNPKQVPPPETAADALARSAVAEPSGVTFADAAIDVDLRATVRSDRVGGPPI